MAMMMTFVMIYDSILTSIIGGIFVLVISIGLKHFIYRDIIRYVNKTDYFGKYPVILSLTTLPIVIPFIFYTLYTL
jgi:xanthine/uracil permease